MLCQFELQQGTDQLARLTAALLDQTLKINGIVANQV